VSKELEYSEFVSLGGLNVIQNHGRCGDACPRRRNGAEDCCRFKQQLFGLHGKRRSTCAPFAMEEWWSTSAAKSLEEEWWSTCTSFSLEKRRSACAPIALEVVSAQPG
jgi:hypothetical protein